MVVTTMTEGLNLLQNTLIAV